LASSKIRRIGIGAWNAMADRSSGGGVQGVAQGASAEPKPPHVPGSRGQVALSRLETVGGPLFVARGDFSDASRDHVDAALVGRALDADLVAADLAVEGWLQQRQVTEPIDRIIPLVAWKAALPDVRGGFRGGCARSFRDQNRDRTRDLKGQLRDE